MARIDKLENFLSDVAVAIKEKRQTPDIKLKPENFDTEILSIVSGGASGEDGLTVEETVYKEMGSPVMAQALDDFDSGDSFVGTKVSNTTKTISFEQTGLTNLASMSADGSVALKNEGLTSNLTYFTFHFLKNGNYITKEITHNLDLESKTCTSPTSHTSINEDGTICIISFSSFIVICNIDKENETVTFNKILTNTLTVNDWTMSTCSTNSGYALYVRGHYLICTSSFTKTDGSTKSQTWFANINGNTLNNLSIIHSESLKGVYGISGSNKYGDNELIFLGVSYDSSAWWQYRIEISNDKVISCTRQKVNGARNCDYTQNGRYAVCYNDIYLINQATGTFDLIHDLSSCSGVNEDCSFYRIGPKWYDISDVDKLNAYSPNYTNASSQYIKDTYPSNITTGKLFATDNYRHHLINSEEAEYTISHTGDGDIKGIVPKTMTMGEVKEVRKLF